MCYYDNLAYMYSSIKITDSEDPRRKGLYNHDSLYPRKVIYTDWYQLEIVDRYS